jgi:hypothetical protein
MQEYFDDILALPADVERTLHQHAGDSLNNAIAWLEERDIDSAPIIDRVGKIALVDYALVWNPAVGRYDFRMYGPDHIGPNGAPALAVPILEGGKFVDLLLIRDFISDLEDPADDDRSCETACCRAPWLGRDNLSDDVVRLYSHPLDWPDAGCTCVCHVALISRAAMKDLRAVKSVICDCIWTAMDAWGWIEDYGLAEHLEFECDDSRHRSINILKTTTTSLAASIAGSESTKYLRVGLRP